MRGLFALVVGALACTTTLYAQLPVGSSSSRGTPVTQTTTTEPRAALALTPLAAPSQLAATGTTQSISLSWSAAAGAIGYRVWREPVGGMVSLLTPSPIAATSFQDIGPFAAMDWYTYRVAAVHPGGESAPAQVTFSPPPPPPAPVTISVGQEGQTTATFCTWSYSVQWSPVRGATEYILVMTEKGNFIRLINWVKTLQYEERTREIRLPATATSYAATTVQAYPQHTYDYSLVALFSPNAIRSLPSPAATFQPPAREAYECDARLR
jgi:hypothetical protein